MNWRSAWLLAAISLLTDPGAAVAADPSPLKVSVVNGDVARELPIVRFDLPKEWKRSFDVVELRGDRPTCPVQVEGSRAWWRASRPIQAGETVSFELRVNDHVESKPVVSAVVTDAGVVLSADGKSILNYNIQAAEPPTGTPARYRRSGHIHPVWTPGGKVVTEEFPADHIHQHAIFSAWVNTEFDGRKTDFWNQGGGTGTVVHKSLDHSESGTVAGGFRATLEHQALEDGANPKPAILETLTIRAYAPPRPDLHVFDVEIQQRAAGEQPLKVLKYHYGGFAIRGAKEWFPMKDADYLTSEGKTRKDGNETRPAWVDLHGPIDGQSRGITVIPHPQSFRGPQPVRLHPSKPYFVFSPPILGEFDITQAATYQATYRVVVHDGPIDPKLCDQLSAEFAEPLIAHP